MSQNPLPAPHALTLARRQFMQTALAGVGMLSLGQLAGAAGIPETGGLRGTPSKKRDQDILNFALNLEYLEAEFYLRAATGKGLGGANGFEDVGSDIGQPGAVTGGRQVSFDTAQIEDLANELAQDEFAHVQFLRTATSTSIPRPAIDLETSFTVAAQAAGLIGPGETFDAFANENNFLLAAFIFEDVGVTAYRGAAPLLFDRNYLSAAAGILGVEAYHAGSIRTLLASRASLIANPGSAKGNITVGEATNAISDLRDTLDGDSDGDQGILNDDGSFNIVPTDINGLAFARTPGQVTSVVYGAYDAGQGLFLPQGVNGRIEA